MLAYFSFSHLYFEYMYQPNDEGYESFIIMALVLAIHIVLSFSILAFLFDIERALDFIAALLRIISTIADAIASAYVTLNDMLQGLKNTFINTMKRVTNKRDFHLFEYEINKLHQEIHIIQKADLDGSVNKRLYYIHYFQYMFLCFVVVVLHRLLCINARDVFIEQADLYEQLYYERLYLEYEASDGSYRNGSVRYNEIVDRIHIIDLELARISTYIRY